MTVDLRVESLQFSGDEGAITLGESDVVVLIGPNNAGKSAALREIYASVRDGNRGPVLTDVGVRREGDDQGLLEWLEGAATRQQQLDSGRGFAGPYGFFSDELVSATWRQPGELRFLADFLVKLLDAEGRLHLAARAANISIRDGVATQPLQRLLQDPELEERLSRAVEEAFSTPISLTRAGGSDLQLLLGRPASEARVDNGTYIDELREMDAVEAQGDGFRSFIGLLLTLIATPYRLVLIDEPEAFLHPPQARQLGRQLGALGESQRFIATHDSDILLGLLERAERLTVIRLRRDANRNIPSVLRADEIRVLWSDPSFRYSNLLDALFHKGVVICEADGDATLYGAALDAEREASGRGAADLLFMQCGGKHKMPTAISALVPMGVPVAAILDIDVLRDEALLEKIVVALGGDWTALRPDWSIVSAAVEQLLVDTPTVESVWEQVKIALGDDPTAFLSESQTRRIREITRSRDGWRRVRDDGIAALPRGEAASAARRICEDLESIGAFVVSVGALEGWAPEIGGHGPRFVSDALHAGAHRSTPIRSFVSLAADFLLDRH